MDQVSVKSSRALHESLSLLKGANLQHQRIWQYLLSAHFDQALELARSSGIEAPRTPQGLAHYLSEVYRARRSKRARIERLLSYVDLMINEAENGLDLKSLLKPLVEEWKIEQRPPQMKPTRRQRKAVDIRDREIRREEESRRMNGEGEQENCATLPASSLAHARDTRRLEKLIIAPASDPYARHQSLVDLAASIARELPPPEMPDHPIGQQYIGVAPGDKRAEWIAYIDQVARRWPAPLTAHDLSRITGLNLKWTIKMIEEWKGLLERGLSEDQRRSMALSMTAEAEAIAREALALVQSSDDERMKAAGLKLALDSLQRRQSLIGADRISLEAKIEATSADWTSHAAAAGLSGDELKQIGDIASRALSRKSSDENKK